MSIEQIFAKYFKPEIQKRGREDYARGMAFILNSSDTQVQGLVKGMPPLKVTLLADDIASPVFKAICTCSTATKGSYCKHMWAMLLAVEKKHSDFLECKTTIEKALEKSKRQISEPIPAQEKTKLKFSAATETRTFEYRTKQSLLRKQQYEKKKTWAKELRQKKKAKLKELENPQPREKYSDAVEQALVFFTTNGFEMIDLPSTELLSLARKYLSRVFHPDKGGTHDEVVVLNHHYEVLGRFIAMIKK